MSDEVHGIVENAANLNFVPANAVENDVFSDLVASATFSEIFSRLASPEVRVRNNSVSAIC